MQNFCPGKNQLNLEHPEASEVSQFFTLHTWSKSTICSKQTYHVVFRNFDDVKYVDFSGVVRYSIWSDSLRWSCGLSADWFTIARRQWCHAKRRHTGLHYRRMWRWWVWRWMTSKCRAVSSTVWVWRGRVWTNGQSTGRRGRQARRTTECWTQLVSCWWDYSKTWYRQLWRHHLFTTDCPLHTYPTMGDLLYVYIIGQTLEARHTQLSADSVDSFAVSSQCIL